jgi:hypothetical protein
MSAAHIKLYYIRAPFHLKADLKVKLYFKGLHLIFRSIRVQIRILRGQIGQIHASAYFQLLQFSDCRTRMCAGVHAFTTKKSLLLHGWLQCARFFFAHLFTQIASHEQPWRPHGQPIATTHSGVLVTKSAFTYARKKIHSGGPRDKKRTYLTSKFLSVWAKNILGSSLMMAHDGHMGQTAYRCVRHGA